MKDLRKADKYRFSLQWSGNTQERVAAGELLEKLGNKKSDFIVLAIWEYLQRHPEALMPGVKIQITPPATMSKEQMMAAIKNAVKTYMEENHTALHPLMDTGLEDAGHENIPGDLSEDDLNVMLENLSVVES